VQPPLKDDRAGQRDRGLNMNSGIIGGLLTLAGAVPLFSVATTTRTLDPPTVAVAHNRVGDISHP
jgi:hypothetical protein